MIRTGTGAGIALAWLGISLMACGSSSSSEPSRPVEATGTAPAAPSGSRAEPVTTTPTARGQAAPHQVEAPPTPAARPQLASDVRARIRALQGEGRRLTRGGDHLAALERFEAALALDPSNGQLECETALVAHRAQNIAAARRHITVALAALPPDRSVPEPLRVPTAMCLYNAGLFYAETNEIEAARSAFTRSLALRPNETVSARLAALPPDPASPGWTRSPPATTFGELATAIQQYLCQSDYVRGEDEQAEAEECPVELEPAEVAGLTGGLSAALYRADFQSVYGGGYYHDVLAVRFGNRLMVAQLAEAYSPGSLGMSAETQVRARAEDVLTGGSPELIVDVTTIASDSDMGTCDYYSSEDRAVILCSIDSGSIQCAGLHYYASSSREHEVCTDEESGEELPDDQATTERDGYACALSFEADHAAFACEAHSVGAPFSGRVPLRSLLDRADRAWPDQWEALAGVAG